MVDAVNRRNSFRLAVEIGIELHVGGARMPVSATLVNLSVTGCRLRSWVVLQRSTPVRFDWTSESIVLPLRGRITSRSQSDAGPAFEYGVEFETLRPGDADVLGQEIANIQRRGAFSLGPQPAQSASGEGRNRRRNYRARVDFPLVMRIDGHAAAHDARVTDISSGGVRILTARPFLTEGDGVVLRFRLPDDALRIHPQGTQDAIVMTPFGLRRRPTNNRRPFQEMQIRSRVQGRLPDLRGHVAYGIEFVEVDAYTREEIARFIHAVQLGELRSKKRARSL